MISDKTYELAVAKAQLLKEKNLTIIPIDNTPLAEVVSTHKRFDTGVTGVMSLIAEAKSTVNDNTDGFNIHGAISSEYINAAANAIRTLQSCCRNYVVPDVEYAYNRLHEEVSLLDTKVEPFNIVMVNSLGIYRDTTMYEMLSPYINIKGDLVKNIAIDIDEATVRELVKTGVMETDARVTELLDSPGVMSEVMGIFKGEPLEDFNRNKATYLPVFLVYNTITDLPPKAKVLNTVWKSYCIRMTAYSGRLAANYIASVKDAVDNNVLYMIPYSSEYVDIKTGRRNITVNGDVYRKLVTSGITPEAIFGAELKGRRTYISDLGKQIDTLTQVYNSELAIRARTNQNKHEQAILIALEGVLYDMIEDPDRLDLLPVNKDRLYSITNTWIRARTPHELSDLYNLVLRAVCVVFYADTDALRYCELMNSIGSSNPDMDAMTVSLMATIEYTSRWYISQINLT